MKAKDQDSSSGDDRDLVVVADVSVARSAFLLTLYCCVVPIALFLLQQALTAPDNPSLVGLWAGGFILYLCVRGIRTRQRVLFGERAFLALDSKGITGRFSPNGILESELEDLDIEWRDFSEAREAGLEQEEGDDDTALIFELRDGRLVHVHCEAFRQPPHQILSAIDDYRVDMGATGALDDGDD